MSPQVVSGEVHFRIYSIEKGNAMKPAAIRWLVGGVFVCIFSGLSLHSGDAPPMGLSIAWKDGQYTFSGGTEPPFLILAGVLFIVYLFLMHEPSVGLMISLPGVFRRFVAFWLDFVFSMLLVVPVLGLIPMLSEWHRTGEFAWTFERYTYVSGDGLQALILLPSMFAALVLCHSISLMRRRPTPATCLMGYRIVGDEGVTLNWGNAMLRVLLGFVAACGWFVTFFAGRDSKKGKIWVDLIFRTHAERI